MVSPPRLRASRFALAIVVSIALVLSAPFIGFVRSWIRATFPGQFARIVGGLLGLVALAALGAAAARIRSHRALRYAAILGALACAAWYSLSTATGVPEVDVVQRFHFVEYGLITFLFYRAWRPLGDPAIFVLPVLAGLIVGTADEWLQWFIPNRVGEMDDIFLNGIAIGCGLLFSLGVDPPSPFSAALRPGSLKRIGRQAAAFVLAFAAFFHAVHLGYDVADDEAGVFKSRYSKPMLETIAAGKLKLWRTHPPPLVLQRVSREDQYMTEGVTHVQERNEQLAAGHAAAAWRENRILEKYYAPVLDTPSYVSKTGHRWSAAQRTDAESRAAAPPGSAAAPYVSAANPYPIYAWSRPRLWGIALALTVAIFTTCAVLDRDSAPKL
jgi:VanZ family protein